jgi:redox-sensitive bicupin YhaK (pirin superfamily)
VALASGEGWPGALPIGQAATVYRSKLGVGEALTHDLDPERRAYLFVVGGAVTCGEAALGPGDTARIEEEPAVALQATRSADLLLIDLP